MYAADGVGLAACQIGEDVAMFVFDCPDDDGERTVGVVCNPVLTLPEGKDRRLEEATRAACRSRVPSSSARAPTWRACRASASTASPSPSTGTGLLARCLQHETDHTHGTVFGDRLPTKARKKLQKEHDNAADDFPPDWPA